MTYTTLELTKHTIKETTTAITAIQQVTKNMHNSTIVIKEKCTKYYLCARTCESGSSLHQY